MPCGKDKVRRHELGFSHSQVEGAQTADESAPSYSPEDPLEGTASPLRTPYWLPNRKAKLNASPRRRYSLPSCDRGTGKLYRRS